MVREVTLADCEEARNVRREFIVNPKSAHRIVNSRINHHRVIVRANVSNFFVHIEEVTVACFYDIAAQAVDSFREVEEYGKARVVYAEAGIATLFSSAAGYVAGNEVTESRVAALEVVVAILFRNVATFKFAGLQLLRIFNFLGNPNAAVVTQRLRHQSQLTLLIAVNRNTRGVNLYERGVSEVCSLAISRNSCRAVATHSIG